MWCRDGFAAQTALLTKSRIDSPTIVDIGAYQGDTVARYRFLFPSSIIYCFEPSAPSFEKLKLRFQNDNKIVPFQLAVDERPGSTEFFINHFEATNSLLRRPSTGRRYYHEAGDLKSITEVRTTSIDEFVKTHGVKGNVLLKLDIQGAELRALRGAAQLLARQQTICIYLEVAFVEHYDQQPLFHDVCDFLEHYGYTLYNFYDLHVAGNGQLRYGDALFVNRFLRAEAIDQLYPTDKA